MEGSYFGHTNDMYDICSDGSVSTEEYLFCSRNSLMPSHTVRVSTFDIGMVVLQDIGLSVEWVGSNFSLY